MSIASPVDKFLLNYVIILLEEVKDMKIDRKKKTKKKKKKNAKTHDIKGSFDTVQSESPQIVSSSFTTKLNSELT